MRRHSRRAVLGTIGALGVGGCLQGSEAPTGPAEADDSAGTSNRSDSASEAAPDDEGTEPDSKEKGEEVHADYETTEVEVRSPDGELLGEVTAAIADTGELRYTGLSDTDSLPEDRGMLFVYDGVADRTFVMREMDFGIDIVYADDEGVITEIHHAPAPGPDEDGEQQEYPGRGQYVLEVNYEWTSERGIEEGDVLEFDL